MKKQLLFLLLLSFTTLFAQQSYYNDVDLNLSGNALRDALATKIINTHTNYLSYSEARECLKIVDLEPGQNQNVLLIYGFSPNICPNGSADDNDHRRRNKNDFGGSANCEWNREHTFPKSLGDPNLGTSGPGADAHHLRAADVQRNSQRGSKKFAAGSGNSGVVNGSYWYPGDEWKGDIARMMMYMYLRYGSQCYPTLVGTGSTVATDSNMVQLFLQWNAEDPVSQYEINRNNYLENTSNQYGQGNRNPFIDDPYLATRIWGGPIAEDTWGIYLGIDDVNLASKIKIFPKPAKNFINIQINDGYIVVKQIAIFSITGKKMISVKGIKDNTNKINVSNLNNGIYFIKVTTNQGVLVEKIILN
jgi:endonuclease I